MSLVSNRIRKELLFVTRSPPPGCAAWSVNEDLTEIQGSIDGPEGTPYEGGKWKLQFIYPENYPFAPPLVRFLTPIYHPNIDTNGRICLDILNLPPKGSWSPSLNLSTILLSLRSLLSSPNPEDPLMSDIAIQMKFSPEEFEKTAKEHTKDNATTKEIVK